ncbi:hypothetical protein GCM10023149_18130 [Mucilaginibacter gynuensis]|uniref:Uncharacterized protein n=1 Tax=Mucilaginibacter gynuensis TaxID=1302236 RepID=A0ABP8G909_9SPHI
MKTYKKPSVSKLVARFDNELKNILMNDLKAIKAAKDQLLNKISADRLSAA